MIEEGKGDDRKALIVEGEAFPCSHTKARKGNQH